MNFVKIFEKIGYKLATQKHLLAIRDGLILSSPLTLAGSMFIILTNLPFSFWPSVMASTGIGPWANKIVSGSFGIIGLVSSFGVARVLAEKNETDGISAGVLSLSAYMILIPSLQLKNSGSGLPLGLLGSKGIFVAIIVGLVTAEIFTWFVKKNIIIKMPESVPPAVGKAFSAMIPGFFILLFWCLIYLITTKIGYESVFSMVVKLVSDPLTFVGAGFIGALVGVLINSLFWTIGIHGAQITGIILGPVWLIASDENRLAYEAGKALPHIVTGTFMNSIVFAGGGGTTIGLALLLAFYAKSKQNKVLGKLALSPSIFNINEPILFGFPIVTNFKMLIPFVLAPVASLLIAYFGTYFGLVARVTGVIIPWATPPIISGYLATGGKISGAVVQIIIIIVSVLIYLPFFKSIDMDYKKLEDELTNKEKN